MLVRRSVTLAVALTLVAVLGFTALAVGDTLVLRPDGASWAGCNPLGGGSNTTDYGPNRWIDNSGLVAAVNTGLAPGTWPQGNENVAQLNCGRVYAAQYQTATYTLATASAVFTFPATVSGYTGLKINGIELWPYVELFSGTYYNDRGMASTTVRYSKDGGSTWIGGQLVTFDEAPEQTNVTPQFVPLSGLPEGVNAIKFDGFTNFGTIANPNLYAAANEIRFTGTASIIPEPGTLVLLATGFIALLAYAWRKRK